MRTRKAIAPSVARAGPRRIAATREFRPRPSTGYPVGETAAGGDVVSAPGGHAVRHAARRSHGQWPMGDTGRARRAASRQGDEMATKLKIKVNGVVHNVSAGLDTPLLYVLHNELHLHGPRFGCGLAQCGACSVLLNGKEIRACVTPVAAS